MAVTLRVDRDKWLDAEYGVIGSLLIAPEYVPAILSAVREEDFLVDADRLIFQAARDLFRSGSPVDPMLIRDRIGPDYSSYMAQLMEITPTAACWQYYVDAMHEQAVSQRARALSDRLSQAVTLEDCRAVSLELAQLVSDGRRLNTWTAPELLESFMQSQDPDAPPPRYISTGLRFLDDGSYIEPGDVVMIGGYPSDGKTALSLMLAWHMAQTYRVGFFSLETSREKLRDRLMAHAAQLDFTDIKRRSLSEENWKDIAQRTGAFSQRQLILVEAAGMSVADIASYSRAAGFQVIFLDYVQLVQPEDGRIRSEQMAGVSRALHTFAQRSGTLVVELAQLTRPERGADKNGREKWREPNMHDLKESGQFEQDADVILLLYRPNPNDGTLQQDVHRLLKIGKNKEGRWGTWPLYFDGARQTFSVMDRSREIMKGLVDAGRKAQTRARTEPEYKQVQLTDITDESGPLPF